MLQETIIKVHGYHLDVYQHVNNARYLEFLEEARWNALEDGILIKTLQEKNWGFAVVNINIAFRRAAVLGDVLEMGDFAEKELYKIGENMQDIDALVTVGSNAHFIADGAQKAGIKVIKKFREANEAICFLDEFLKDDDTVLVKASRGMHFEKIVEALAER